MRKIDQHDHYRITEDGAEAVALALAHRHRAWRIIRRIQRARSEWGRPRSIAARLSGKLKQVGRNPDVDRRCAR
jgi:DNA-binding PadR family transcriptional regulator